MKLPYYGGYIGVYIGEYVGNMLGEWKRKWKLLYFISDSQRPCPQQRPTIFPNGFNTGFIGVILG